MRIADTGEILAIPPVPGAPLAQRRQDEMTIVMTGLSTSLDGFIAGGDDSPELPLGIGGDRLFKWLEAYRSNSSALIGELLSAL